jgi:hypothetical protein
MKSATTMALVAVALLALSGVWFLPTVIGQGRENSIPEKVAELERLVAELTGRVDELEGGFCTCQILNLQPLGDFPIDPSEGDLCVAYVPEDPQDPDAPYGNALFGYFRGEWVRVAPVGGGQDPIIR